MRPKLIPLAAALMILLTACGASSNVVDNDDDAVAPFDAVLIELFGTTDTDQYLAAQEQLAAELVAACMKDAGFDFVIDEPVAPGPEPDPLSLEDAETLGFGIIAGFRQQFDDSQTDVVPAEALNRRYLSTLTAAEIERFVFTLDGEEPPPGQLPEDGGCNGQASDLAYADWSRFMDDLAHFTGLGEERDTHPDWVATRNLWRQCMQDLGYDYLEPEDIRLDVVARMRETVNAVYPGGQLPLVESEGRLVLDPAVDLLLDDLQDFERAAATANVQCSLPLVDDFAAVEFEVQQAFVDRNQEVIDELLAAAK